MKFRRRKKASFLLRAAEKNYKISSFKLRPIRDTLTHQRKNWVIFVLYHFDIYLILLWGGFVMGSKKCSIFVHLIGGPPHWSTSFSPHFVNISRVWRYLGMITRKYWRGTHEKWGLAVIWGLHTVKRIESMIYRDQHLADIALQLVWSRNGEKERDERISFCDVWVLWYR